MTTSVDGGPRALALLPMHQRVAAEVRAHKGRLQVTQVELAALLQQTQQSVSRKLNGRSPFSIDEIELLADRFGIHPAVLFGGDGEAPEGPPGARVRREGIEPPTRCLGDSDLDECGVIHVTFGQAGDLDQDLDDDLAVAA